MFLFSYKLDGETELRLPTDSDAAEIFAVVRENLEHLKLWMPWATDDYSLESAREYVRRNLQGLADIHEFNASVVVRGKIVGQIGFHGVDWTNKSINIGYWLARSAEGNGLMTRACRVFVNHAFDQMRLNRVQINCAEGNLKSRAIAERLGFRLEGTLRQTQWLHDHFENMAIYGVLLDEWSGEN